MHITEEEYKRILSIIPISCVDLLIETDKDFSSYLLLKRNNSPAKGEWWTPGGRILIGESFHQAVIRKLKEECGISFLDVKSIKQIQTFELFLDNNSHTITTFFHIIVNPSVKIILDNQSTEYSWTNIEDYQGKVSHPALIKAMELSWIT